MGSTLVGLLSIGLCYCAQESSLLHGRQDQLCSEPIGSGTIYLVPPAGTSNNIHLSSARCPRMPQITIRTHCLNPIQPWEPEVICYHPDSYIAPVPEHPRPSRLQTLLQQNCPRVAVPTVDDPIYENHVVYQHRTAESASLPSTYTGCRLFPRLANHTREQLFVHIWNLKRIILDHERETEKLKRFLAEDRIQLQKDTSMLQFQVDAIVYVKQELHDEKELTKQWREGYVALESRFRDLERKMAAMEVEVQKMLAFNSDMAQEMADLREGKEVLLEEVDWLNGGNPAERVQPNQPQAWVEAGMSFTGGYNSEEPESSEGDESAPTSEEDVDFRTSDTMLQFERCENALASEDSDYDAPDQTPPMELDDQVRNYPNVLCKC